MAISAIDGKLILQPTHLLEAQVHRKVISRLLADAIGGTYGCTFEPCLEVQLKSEDSVALQ